VDHPVLHPGPATAVAHRRHAVSSFCGNHRRGGAQTWTTSNWQVMQYCFLLINCHTCACCQRHMQFKCGDPPLLRFRTQQAMRAVGPTGKLPGILPSWALPVAHAVYLQCQTKEGRPPVCVPIHTTHHNNPQSICSSTASSALCTAVLAILTMGLPAATPLMPRINWPVCMFVIFQAQLADVALPHVATGP